MLTVKMRGIHQAILAIAVLVGMGLAVPASADTIQILLLGGTSQKITFQGTSNSSSVLLQLGTCSAGTCTWSEAGKGSVSYGQNQLSGYSGVWSLSIPETGNNTYNLTLNSGYNGDTNDWGITQPSAINFDWGKPGCSGSSCLLTGDLQLGDLLQSGGGGVFNLSMDANLVITGGSLASLINRDDMFDYTVAFNTDTGLGSLRNGQLLTATGSSGEVQTPTPEPTSLLLFGAGVGLLGLGRRLRGHGLAGQH